MSATGDSPDVEDGGQLAQDIIAAIERPKKGDDSNLSPDAPGGWLPQLDLPGFGSEREDCGDEIPHFCECCGHSFDVGRTCAQSMCPRCGPAWVLKRAGTSRENGEATPGYVGKLIATAKMMSAARDEAVFTHHVTFNPPPDDWFLEAEDPLQRTFDVINEILTLMDAEGVVVYHPYRGDNEDGDDRGEWKKRIFSGREWDGDVRDELRPSGHFHAIVASPFIPGGDVTRKVEEQTGWVIDRVAKRDGSGRSLDGPGDVARAVTYALSHTGVDTSGERNVAAIRRYGSTYKRANVYTRDLEAADHAVRTVAPKTLGISANSVRCMKKVSDEEASEGSDALASLLEGEGDGGDVEATATTEPEDVELVPCEGAVLPIDQAPHYLDDPEWRGQARHADELRREWEAWEEGDGWPGG